MGFADARRSEQDDVAAFVQKASAGQFSNKAAIHRRLGVKVLEPLEDREAREPEIELDRLLMPGLELGGQEIAEEVGITPLLRSLARGLSTLAFRDSAQRALTSFSSSPDCVVNLSVPWVRRL
jgi:hypothetical protein